MGNDNRMKPQDILVLLKLLLWDERSPWSFAKLATELGMSASEVHGAIKRAEHSHLYAPLTKRPKRAALREFVLFGLPYVFPGNLSTTRKSKGMPTAHSAAPLNKEVVSAPADQWIWPTKKGKVLGMEFTPLYRSAPVAAGKDSRLYEILSLIDSLRGGKARERELAKTHLDKLLGVL